MAAKTISLSEAQAKRRRKAAGMAPLDGGLDLKLAHEPQNDLGNARRLKERFGDKLIYVMNVGWLAWVGTHWSIPQGLYVARELAQATAELIRHEALALEQALLPELEAELEAARRQRATAKDLADLEKSYASRWGKLHAWSVTSGNDGKSVAMLAQAAPMLRVDVKDLDANPALFNVQNGTIELHARGPEGLPVWVFREQRQEDRITKMAKVAYQEGAIAVDWERALGEILPDEQEREFLRRWTGYGLTGDNHEQSILLMTGSGGNGKSTIVETIERLQGDYALRLAFESLLVDDRKRGSEATPDMADLPGCRMVVAAEPDAGARLSPGSIKTLTERKSMKARQLNMPFFTFLPQHKITLMCNEKPDVHASDDGTWRRIHVLHFGQKFVRREDLKKPENDGAKARDDGLEDALEGQLPGILNWMLEGWARWAEDGLAVPDSVRAATADYREDSDPVGSFIAARLTRLDSSADEETVKRTWLSGRDLYEGYKLWCVISGKKPWSETRFGKVAKTKLASSTVGIVRYLGIYWATQWLQDYAAQIEEARKGTGAAGRAASSGSTSSD
jgi:putative DNA primase/helicase